MRSLYPNSIISSEKGDRVAVIMRTLDRPILLVRALASVLHQTHKDWHLYLVNDGGDKGTLENLLKGYHSAFDGRLTVIHHKVNQGMEAASNSALQKAEGSFIIVHDDDDAWHPAFLQKAVSFLNKTENNAYVAVATNCEVIHEELRKDRITETGRWPWGLFSENISFSENLYSNTIPPISLLIRKPIVDIIGRFNEALPVLGDLDYNLRLFQLGDIGSITEILAYYHHRVNQGNDIYGNSVLTGMRKHWKYNNLYNNALIREILRKNPEALGLMRLIAANGKQHTDKLNEILGWQRHFYEKLDKKLKYVGFWGRVRREWARLRKKL